MSDPTEFLGESNLFYLFDLVPEVMRCEKIRLYVLSVWIYGVEHEEGKRKENKYIILRRLLKLINGLS